ncbi:CopG family transcriptional regulator / antitoxin EndoAI [Candidatus Magnetomoraceae bacterium gMMP-15]
MHRNISTSKARLNVLIPFNLKSRLSQLSKAEGKTVSMLVRESIEAKLANMEKQKFEEQMKHAYLDLAGENLRICNDFKNSDAENI